MKYLPLRRFRHQNLLLNPPRSRMKNNYQSQALLNHMTSSTQNRWQMKGLKAL